MAVRVEGAPREAVVRREGRGEGAVLGRVLRADALEVRGDEGHAREAPEQRDGVVEELENADDGE